jgi:hypothetical protein
MAQINIHIHSFGRLASGPCGIGQPESKSDCYYSEFGLVSGLIAADRIKVWMSGIIVTSKPFSLQDHLPRQVDSVADKVCTMHHSESRTRSALSRGTLLWDQYTC